MQDVDPVPEREILEVDTVVEERPALERELEVVLLGLLPFRQEEAAQVRVVVVLGDVPRKA